MIAESCKLCGPKFVGTCPHSPLPDAWNSTGKFGDRVDWNKWNDAAKEEFFDELERLQAENDRLRTALEELTAREPDGFGDFVAEDFEDTTILKWRRYLEALQSVSREKK